MGAYNVVITGFMGMACRHSCLIPALTIVLCYLHSHEPAAGIAGLPEIADCAVLAHSVRPHFFTLSSSSNYWVSIEAYAYGHQATANLPTFTLTDSYRCISWNFLVRTLTSRYISCV